MPLSAPPPPPLRRPVWAHSSQDVVLFSGSCHHASPDGNSRWQCATKHCFPRSSHNLGLEAIPGPHGPGLSINTVNVSYHPVIIVRPMTFLLIGTCLGRHGTAFCGERDPGQGKACVLLWPRRLRHFLILKTSPGKVRAPQRQFAYLYSARKTRTLARSDTPPGHGWLRTSRSPVRLNVILLSIRQHLPASRAEALSRCTRSSTNRHLWETLWSTWCQQRTPPPFLGSPQRAPSGGDGGSQQLSSGCIEARS